MVHIIEVKEFSKLDSTNKKRQITLLNYMMIPPLFTLSNLARNEFDI